MSIERAVELFAWLGICVGYLAALAFASLFLWALWAIALESVTSLRGLGSWLSCNRPTRELIREVRTMSANARLGYIIGKAGAEADDAK